MPGASHAMFVAVIVVALAFIESGNPPDITPAESGLLVITVATDDNDGFHRFAQSADMFHHNVKVLGRGETWRGGDVARYSGGGQKVRLLRNAMEGYKNNENLIVMFVDSYDVVLMNGAEEILDRFHKFDAKIVFSAEAFCWPDSSLAEFYPTVKLHEKRYLNSGGFIGYASQIHAMLNKEGATVADSDDDQLFYSKIYLDPARREELKIDLDKRSSIFQNLNGALDEVSVKFEDGKSFLFNVKTDTAPAVVHGNGPIKNEFNILTNYIPDQWNPVRGCLACQTNIISFEDVKLEDYPTLTIAMFVEHHTTFIEDFFLNIAALSYPKDRIDLFIHYSLALHTADVVSFTGSSLVSEYRSVSVHDPSAGFTEGAARQLAVEESIRHGSDYYFAIDSDAQIENKDMLQLLIQANRSIVAPMLVRPGKLWSNFWGSLNGEGFYRRSADYVDIVQSNRTGLWNVPYMSGAYLVQRRHLPTLAAVDFAAANLDPDIAVCKHLREKMVFMYVDNEVYYGHLVDNEFIETTRKRPDLYMIFENRYTWDRKYLNSEYKKVLHDTPFAEVLQPCPDVFWVPLFSPAFCRDLIDEMENFGRWSGGGHEDNRLTGGYENVPTVDIHTNQIGWERHWLHILREFIAPITAKVYDGFYTEARATMNFVVRYRPGEQDRLRPHSDSSTFSVNLALNDPATDYQGGGTHFLRYNCSVIQSRVGWTLLHPGRVTHQHEGLPTTSGTRYIMVSFVDP